MDAETTYKIQENQDSSESIYWFRNPMGLPGVKGRYVDIDDETGKTALFEVYRPDGISLIDCCESLDFPIEPIQKYIEKIIRLREKILKVYQKKFIVDYSFKMKSIKNRRIPANELKLKFPEANAGFSEQVWRNQSGDAIALIHKNILDSAIHSLFLPFMVVPLPAEAENDNKAFPIIEPGNSAISNPDGAGTQN